MAENKGSECDERRLTELEGLVELLREKKNREELLDFPWVGNLGSWYWSLPSNTVVCNDQKILNLGFTKEEIPEKVGFQFFTDRLHPEDYESVMHNMRQHLGGLTQVYEVEYRILAKDGSYRWYYDRGKVTQRDELGKPLYVVGIVFDITIQKEMERRLEEQNRILHELANQDPLTKALNRRALFTALEAAVVRCREQSEDLCVLMLDIDFFKAVNDTYGHLVGDQVLIELVGIIKNSIRKTDILGRYGGEEFVVVFDGVGIEWSTQVAERVRKAVVEHEFPQGLRISISGGLAVYSGQALDMLLNQADERMYTAKRAGRNRIVGP